MPKLALALTLKAVGSAIRFPGLRRWRLLVGIHTVGVAAEPLYAQDRSGLAGIGKQQHVGLELASSVNRVHAVVQYWQQAEPGHGFRSSIEMAGGRVAAMQAALA